MVYGIFPDMVDIDVSWESHLLGGLAGILLAFLFRKTKIDFNQVSGEEEPVEDHNDDNYFTYTSSTDNSDINYFKT